MGETVGVMPQAAAPATPPATTDTTNSGADSSGYGPAAYWPLTMSGVCHSPQIRPDTSTGCGTRASSRRVSM